jgi:outer membrane protein TolC
MTNGTQKPTLSAIYGVGLISLLFICSRGTGQQPVQKQAGEKVPAPRLAPEAKNEGRSAVQVASDEAIAAGVGPAMPISLPIALRLAVTTNLDIAQAREVLNTARALSLKANASLLPDLTMGGDYTNHQGNIQKTEGNIEKVNRDALFVGGGPVLSIGIADAIFAPLAARQVEAATTAGLQRVNNETLAAVAEAYFAVLRNRRRLARVDETLDFLLAGRPTEIRSGSKGLYPLIQEFVEAGGPEALRSELERVRVEVLGRQEERVGILQDYRVASAELARLLRLDPATPLWPVEDFRRPLGMPGQAWLSLTVQELAAVALQNRPDIAENQALVRATLARLRNARYRPFLPTLAVNYSWGDYGGGPDQNILVTTSGGKATATAIAGLAGQPGSYGPGAEIKHFAPRADLDVSLIWRLQNLGFGNLAEVRQAQAAYRQQEFHQLQVQDLVVAQVVQAYEQVTGWRHRIDVTSTSLFDAAGRPKGPVFESIRLSFDKVRAVPGSRTLEVLDSIRGLSSLLDAYGNAVTDYERARFRLIFSLGMPAEGLWNPEALPKPPTAGEKGNRNYSPYESSKQPSAPSAK